MQFKKHVGEYCWSGYLLNWGDGKERSGELLTQAGFEERGRCWWELPFADLTTVTILPSYALELLVEN